MRRTPALEAGRDDGAEHELRQLLGSVALRMCVSGDDLATRTGLSALEIAVLARLVLDGPTSAKVLIADLGLPRSTLTALADRLERRALLRRQLNPEDRRSVLLSATEAALQALDCGHQRYAAIAHTLVAAASNQERGALADLLRRMRRTLGALDSD